MSTEQLASLMAAIQERESQGCVQVGWKLGFGSPQGKQTLGIDTPLVAALFDTGRRIDGSTIHVSGLSKPMVEPELAAWIVSDCPASASDDRLVAAIGSIVPAIELADVRFAPTNAQDVLRSNIYQEAWIAAPDDGSGWNSGGSRRVDVMYGDDSWRQEEPESMTGSYLEGLRACNAVAAATGRGLCAGDVVFLGSVIPPQEVHEGEFRVSVDEGAEIRVQFAM